MVVVLWGYSWRYRFKGGGGGGAVDEIREIWCGWNGAGWSFGLLFFFVSRFVVVFCVCFGFFASPERSLAMLLTGNIRRYILLHLKITGERDGERRAGKTIYLREQRTDWPSFVF